MEKRNFPYRMHVYFGAIPRLLPRFGAEARGMALF